MPHLMKVVGIAAVAMQVNSLQMTGSSVTALDSLTLLLESAGLAGQLVQMDTT
jgi:hypothetical protein